MIRKLTKHIKSIRVTFHSCSFLSCSLISFAAASICFDLTSCKNQLPEEPFSFDRIYYYAIQEDVKKIMDSINSFNESSLTEDQKESKRKYNSRFLEYSEKPEPGFSDSLLTDIITTFQNYWIEVLMKESSLKEADAKYRKVISDLLISSTDKQDLNSIINDPVSALGLILKKRGYFTRIDRTGNLMDFIAWKNQEVKIYDVKVQDTILKVPVILIDSVLCYGWEGFATFGNFYPGGWTSPDTLFCITKDYDLASEKFLVSYLTHETQHLYDSRNFTGSWGWIAEHRAKLAELSVSDSTTYILLGGFIKGNKNDRRLPHPYAEYRLIKGLSENIFKTDFVTDMNEWKKIPESQINSTARQLLLESTKTLKKKKHGKI